MERMHFSNNYGPDDRLSPNGQEAAEMIYQDDELRRIQEECDDSLN